MEKDDKIFWLGVAFFVTTELVLPLICVFAPNPTPVTSWPYPPESFRIASIDCDFNACFPSNKNKDGWSNCMVTEY